MILDAVSVRNIEGSHWAWDKRLTDIWFFFLVSSIGAISLIRTWPVGRLVGSKRGTSGLGNENKFQSLKRFVLRMTGTVLWNARS